MNQFAEWLNSNEILMKNAFELTRQCIEFSESRMHEDFQTLEKLMKCKNFEQVADCHKLFAERASKQYLNQFKGVSRHLAGMMGTEKRSGPIDATALPD